MQELPLISRTLAAKMLTCIEEYERIKRKESKTFKTVKSFCQYHKFSHQNFMKIYHRYQQFGTISSLIPQKRGPKYQTRRTDLNTEQEILRLRLQGNNRYEIRNILLSKNMLAPSASTVYNLCRKHGLNKLKPPQKQERRKIIMSKIGELVHIDCHQLSKGITIAEPQKTYYLLGVIDDYSRLAWVEVLENKKALTVMFATLKAFNMLKLNYNVEIDAVMTDNGAEFGCGQMAKNKDEHPFERLLIEMQMKHRYTKPYHPQTNGKIERFWKTLKEDFIDEALYNDFNDLKTELLGFLVYYNEHRPHSALNNLTPKLFAQNM
ncbi:MAG: transposase family protein [Clostridia bacterium]|nr:transposase family protein [Alphaproteobacteria bacterium]MBO5395065.1 transposase family protein [Clostridia bacterium]